MGTGPAWKARSFQGCCETLTLAKLGQWAGYGSEAEMNAESRQCVWWAKSRYCSICFRRLCWLFCFFCFLSERKTQKGNEANVPTFRHMLNWHQAVLRLCPVGTFHPLLICVSVMREAETHENAAVCLLHVTRGKPPWTSRGVLVVSRLRATAASYRLRFNSTEHLQITLFLNGKCAKKNQKWG